jgi:hypothetical protein
MFQSLLSFCRRLFGGASQATAQAPEDERRVWVRFPSSAQTVVQPVHNGIPTQLSARVRNVSRGGINLTVNKTFNPGELIAIELPGASPERTSSVLACVVHVNPVDSEQWSLGCTFSTVLEDDDLAEFGARRERPAKPENRAWKRFNCKVKASCQSVDDPEKKTWPAEVVNISAGGIGLQVAHNVEMGTLLNLQLEGASGQTRTLLACVVHVIASNSERILGCNFIHELSEDDLKALL